MEIWKDVLGYEGIYQVSNKGNVKSLQRLVYSKNGSYRTVKGSYISLVVNNKGYFKIILHFKGLRTHVVAHRLVAIAFIPNPENKPQVNHKDGNKLNNNDWNLEWNTSLENVKHSWNNGLSKHLYGEKGRNSKLTDKDILEIRKSNKSRKELSNYFNVSYMNIVSILNRITWKHI